jgi:hypothetical protein
MVDGQSFCLCPAVLAGILIPSEDFLFRELYSWSGSFDHISQADHRWPGYRKSNRSNDPSSIVQHLCFASDQQTQGSFCRTNMEGLVVRIEKKYRIIHL